MCAESATLKEWRINREKMVLELKGLEELLTPSTKLVAFTHCSNILGYINPVKEISKLVQTVSGSCWRLSRFVRSLHLHRLLSMGFPLLHIDWWTCRSLISTFMPFLSTKYMAHISPCCMARWIDFFNWRFVVNWPPHSWQNINHYFIGDNYESYHSEFSRWYSAEDTTGILQLRDVLQSGRHLRLLVWTGYFAFIGISSHCRWTYYRYCDHVS